MPTTAFTMRSTARKQGVPFALATTTGTSSSRGMSSIVRCRRRATSSSSTNKQLVSSSLSQICRSHVGFFDSMRSTTRTAIRWSSSSSSGGWHVTPPKPQPLESQKEPSMFSQIFKILGGRDHEGDPKQELERRFLYFALMALKVRELRGQNSMDGATSTNHQKPEPASTTASTTTTMSQSLQQQQQQLPPLTKELLLSVSQNETLFEACGNELDKLGGGYFGWGNLDRLTNGQFRATVHDMMDPQILHLFQTFAQVDQELGLTQQLPKHQEDAEVDNNNNNNNDQNQQPQSSSHHHSTTQTSPPTVTLSKLLDILQQEHEYTEMLLTRNRQEQEQAMSSEQEERQQQQEGSDAQNNHGTGAATTTTTTAPNSHGANNPYDQYQEPVSADKLLPLLQSQQGFLRTKQGALEMLLQFHGVSAYQGSVATSSDEIRSSNDPQSLLDYFGMPISIVQDDHDPSSSSSSDETTQLIRHHQTLNMARSALIRQHLGYSILCLRSTLPPAPPPLSWSNSTSNTTTNGSNNGDNNNTSSNSNGPVAVGRGVFVDGYAPMGSFLAFQPGEVWTKELLYEASVANRARLEHGEYANKDPSHQANLQMYHYLIRKTTSGDNDQEHEEEEQFEKDEFMTSLRFDDLWIDSRQSPVTVLTKIGSLNPFALGHMVNHPPPTGWPNAQSVFVNFSEESMAEADRAWRRQATHPNVPTLARYIPNTYVREPTWKTSFFHSTNPLLMHGLGLMARRDVCNEEVVYDYRLQTDRPTPNWYHHITYGDPVLDRQQPHLLQIRKEEQHPEGLSK